MAAAVTLSALTLSSPTLLGGTLSVDVGTLPLTFLADADAKALEVAVQETGVSSVFTNPTASGSSARFSFSLDLPADLGIYHLTFRAKDAVGTPTRVSPNFTLEVIRGTNEGVPQALPPAGIRVLRRADSVKVEWQTPQDDGFLGVRVAISTDASGVTTPFVQVGDLIQSVVRRAQDVLTSSERVAMNGLTRVTTLEEELTVVPYSSVEFLKSSVSGVDTFYIMLTTLIQDPDTHHVHESFAAGPFECSFVDLRKVTLTDFPGATTPEANAVSLIKSMTPLYPKLDLGPRTEPRDLLVDPIAIECANKSTRDWFTRVAQSVSSLVAVDDADGDGISDDPDTSAYKQALARAFQLTSSQVQDLIDSQFNVLGERVGRTRGAAEASVVDVLFYLTSRPTRRYPVTEAGIVATLPDSDTPSLSFKVMASAALDAESADSFYIPEKGWWGFTLPCVCMTTGSEGNVGAETIRTPISGVDSALQCINLTKADLGDDSEPNASFAAGIANRAVVGVDTGRRLGYQETAQACTGVIRAEPICSGDLEMLRDWDPIRQKHLFGTVDIYARGRTTGQSTETLPYLHPTFQGTYGSASSYSTLELDNASALRLRFTQKPTDPVAAVVELLADRGGSALSFYFGVERAQYDASTGCLILHPDDLTYTLNAAGEKVFGGKNSTLITSTSNGTTLRAMVSLWGPLTMVPKQQPVTKVYSIVGEEAHTGVVPTSSIRLIRTADPLLEGDSTRAGDRVTVDNTTSITTVPVTFQDGGVDVFSLGEGVAVTVNLQGVAQDVVSVLSSDAHTRYLYGVAYKIVPLDRYATYGIQRLPGDSKVIGGQIPLGEEIQVTYNAYRFREHFTLQKETLTLNGGAYTALTKPGVVTQAWGPATHGLTTLSKDADLTAAKVAGADRWIKVTYQANGVTTLAVAGRDYTLAVTDAGVELARYTSGGSITSGIPDGGAVEVTYFTAEPFQVVTGYPQFLSQIKDRVEATRHGGADVLVKTMHESLVDISLTVTLAKGASSDVLDRKIRTVITAAFDAATTLLSQAEVVSKVKALPGVKNISLPFAHMAKADGSYDIGMIVPTGTAWDPIATLQAEDALWAAGTNGVARTFSPRTFVTRKPVLRYKTIPSGGLADAYVGLLYEGEAFQRCLTLEEFQAATSAAFYIVGINEHIDGLPVDSGHYGKVLMVTPAPTTYRPQPIATPALQAYRVTYQVYGEAGAQDIPISPTEYLRPGRITINYVTEEEV